MKRALLIAGGTVGGLGAVLAITPPQFNQATSVGALSGSLGTPAASGKVTTSATTHAPTPAKSAVSKATAAASASASSSQPQAATSAPAATTTATAPAASGYSGTVTGASFAARNYGNLSATVTFSNGQITRVSASQSPSSWSQNSLPTLIPYASSGKITVEQIKTYAAEQLPCAISNSCRSQASFTATAFWSSVKSAINKAGL
jgi:hypothetical protein